MSREYVDYEATISLARLDFDFVMVASAIFSHEDVEVVECEYVTEDGCAFSLIDDGDQDDALELWIESALEWLSYQAHEAWKLECRAAGYEVEEPKYWVE